MLRDQSLESIELTKCSCGAVFAPSTVPDGECQTCRAEDLEAQAFELRDRLEDALIDRDVRGAA